MTLVSDNSISESVTAPEKKRDWMTAWMIFVSIPIISDIVLTQIDKKIDFHPNGSWIVAIVILLMFVSPMLVLRKKIVRKNDTLMTVQLIGNIALSVLIAASIIALFFFFEGSH